MKGYKRLTDREIAERLKNTVEKSWDSDSLEAQCYIRLADLEDKIESGEIDYVADSKTEQTITDLLIEFDEMGFAPTTVCPNLEQYATEWRERVRKEFARLTAENAELRATLSKMETVEKELRERLEKAVELPCKLGDTIYKVYDRCDGYNCPYNGNYGQWRCHYEGERRCEPFIKIEQFCYSDIPFVNDTVFVSREAAEARLKEIKEKKDD